MRALGKPKEAKCPECGFTRISSSIKGETRCSHCRKYFVFDRERWKKYKKDWEKKNPEKYKARTQRHNKKISELYEELRTLFGNKCDLCGEPSERLEFHERNNKRHPLNSIYIKNHIDDFILLGKDCHEATHWAHNKLNMSYIMFKKQVSPFL